MQGKLTNFENTKQKLKYNELQLQFQVEHIVRVMRKWAKDNRVPVWIKSLEIFELNAFTSFQVLWDFCFTVFIQKLPWSTDFDLRAPFRVSLAVFIFSVKRKSERSQYLWSVSHFLVLGGNKKRWGLTIPNDHFQSPRSSANPQSILFW